MLVQVSDNASLHRRWTNHLYLTLPIQSMNIGVKYSNMLINKSGKNLWKLKTCGTTKIYWNYWKYFFYFFLFHIFYQNKLMSGAFFSGISPTECKLQKSLPMSMSRFLSSGFNLVERLPSYHNRGLNKILKLKYLFCWAVLFQCWAVECWPSCAELSQEQLTTRGQKLGAE